MERGYPEGKYFKVTMKFENPFDANYPAVQEDWPFPEAEVEGLQGKRITRDFYAHKNGLYRMSLRHPQMQGGGIEYLMFATENCDPIEINNFKIKEA